MNKVHPCENRRRESSRERLEDEEVTQRMEWNVHSYILRISRNGSGLRLLTTRAPLGRARIELARRNPDIP